ncbi:hypothetical protein HK098_005317 [Nowakowskiella sp. JEL0407]|nr:hypothetical protein HK098_005317 [Nowakowskiella sp. JEL0407]
MVWPPIILTTNMNSEDSNSPSLNAPTFLETSTYSSRTKKLLSLINTLRDSGAHIDLDLPTVVVCGNQSAGKSSLLEGLCGITLPRGDGTCTRCVTEVRLSDSASQRPNQSKEWSCSIKLRFEFDVQGRALGKHKEVVFKSDITEKSELELWVRRAQKAVLNPNSDANKFLDVKFENSAKFRDKDAKSNELKFSRNIVCLEIRNSGVNLTLIDLPGIIRSVESREDSQYIDLIQDLVHTYIKKDRTIVVATITCKDEIENQAIVNWSKEIDPYGLRTIGVLTKPDTIEAATHDKWVSILLGHHYNLKLGYWMVLNPSKADLDRGVTLEEARKMEAEFFSTAVPWVSLSSQYGHRFGTEHLRNELSRQLSISIDSCIPDMKLKTEEFLQKTNTEIMKLPPRINKENARYELINLIRQFCSNVGNNISAHLEFKEFYQKVKGHFEVFKQNVMDTRPVFVFDEKKAGGSSSSSLMPSLPSLLPSFLSSSDDSKRSSTLKQKQNSPTSPSLNREDLIDVSRPISLSDLRMVIESQKGRELQGYTPYSAFEFMVLSFQKHWAKFAAQCVLNISSELHLLTSKLVDESFGRFANLQGKLRFILQVYQSEIYRKTLDALTTLIQMERKSPFTMNTEDFARLKSEALVDFKSIYESRPSGTGMPGGSIYPQTQGKDSLNRAVSALHDIGYTNVTPQALLSKLSPTTPVLDEIFQIISSTDGYFSISSKRYVDNVPMTIDFTFLEAFKNGIESESLQKLGVLKSASGENYLEDEGGIEYLLKEGVEVEEKRKQLEETRERLSSVWKSLNEFGF